jgi:ankyrin repeat protein
MMAARYGPEDSVDLLLSRGASLSARNIQGLGAADFARLGGREKLAARLAPATR